MRILLIEDDLLLGDGLKNGLKQAGYTVDWLQDGAAAKIALDNETFDLLILDLNLPRIDGLSLLRKIRAQGNKVPVLILTANDSSEAAVTGLDSGADDYLSKPFDLDEICARLRALQRRVASRACPLLIYGALTLDPAAHITTLNNKELILSRREFTMLQMLLEKAGQVVTRKHLQQSLYSWDEEIDSNALEVHIHNLRKKLGVAIIYTIRGIGYMIAKEPPAEFHVPTTAKEL
jgi:two-component system response regulator QseB